MRGHTRRCRGKPLFWFVYADFQTLLI